MNISSLALSRFVKASLEHHPSADCPIRKAREHFYLEAAPPGLGAPVSPSAMIREVAQKVRAAVMREDPIARVARSSAREELMSSDMGEKG